MKKIICLIILNLTFSVQAAIVYVDKTATGNNDGSSWVDAFTTITPAIAVSMNGDEIDIAQGIYIEVAELTIDKPLMLKGGFPLGGGVQDIVNNPTTIDGNFSHRVILDSNGTASPTILEGLIIKNGLVQDDNGAGIYDINGSSDLVLNWVIVGSNTIALNGSTGRGAGISCINSIINNSTINNNSILGVSGDNTGLGGGIFPHNSTTINNSIISNNRIQASHFALGGGIATAGSSQLTLVNSLVAKNLAQKYTQNSTFPGVVQGGGVLVASGSFFTVTNSILWDNTKIIEFNSIEEPSEFEAASSLSVSIKNSLIKKQNPTGTGNIDATVIGFDPLFVSQIGQNYRLLAGSPLINSGNNSFLPVDTPMI